MSNIVLRSTTGPSESGTNRKTGHTKGRQEQTRKTPQGKQTGARRSY